MSAFAAPDRNMFIAIGVRVVARDATWASGGGVAGGAEASEQSSSRVPLVPPNLASLWRFLYTWRRKAWVFLADPHREHGVGGGHGGGEDREGKRWSMHLTSCLRDGETRWWRNKCAHHVSTGPTKRPSIRSLAPTCPAPKQCKGGPEPPPNVKHGGQLSVKHMHVYRL